MKVLATTLFIITVTVASAFFLPLQSQQPAFTTNLNKDKSYFINVDILEGSFISIDGKTNVNTFSCLYCDDITAYNKTLKIEKTDSIWHLEDAFIKVKSEAFDCGIRELTKDFKELLCAESYPYLSIEINKLKYIDINGCNIMAYIDLTIAGTTRQIQLPLTIKNDHDKTLCTGTTTIDIEEFNIEPPSKFFGLVKVNQEIDVNFHLLLDVVIDSSL